MNYTVVAMTAAVLVLAVFLPLSAIAFVMIKSGRRGEEFGLGSGTLQDEMQAFLAEFERGPVAPKPPVEERFRS